MKKTTTWYNHFATLLGKEPGTTEQEEIDQVLHELNIEDGEFTEDELQKAKKSLQDGKAAGPDDIPPEVIKSCNFDSIILDFANNLLTTGDKPKQWSESI